MAGVNIAQEEYGLLGDFFATAGDTLVVEEEMALDVALGYVAWTLGTLVNIPPEGYNVRFDWTAVAGATGAQVDSAGLRIASSTTQKSMGELKAEKSGNHVVITTGNRRIYSLKLNGLKYVPGGGADAVTLSSQSHVQSLGNFHLVASIPDGSGGWLPPLHAVPPVAAQGMIPPTLRGASFSSGVLRLPDLVAPKIRLTLAEGSQPDDFQARGLSLDSVVGTESVVPTDVQVIAPDGSVAFAFPGPFPPEVPPVDVDLRIPLQTALAAALAAGQAPDVTFKIKGSGTISLAITSARGALLSEFPGVSRAILQGEPVVPGFGPALASEVPSSATADLTVRYDGIRLLETVTDQTPHAVGGLAGAVVTDAGAVREFPPQGLDGRVIRRIGVIGRAPVDCELHAQLVEAASGKAVAAPGVLAIPPSTAIKTHWIELPEHPPLTLPTNLSLRANKGRFLWVKSPHPLVKVAIYDPDYPGREVTLGGAVLSVPNSGTDATSQPAYALPKQVFVNAPPALDSPLFLTVDLADLVLRYAR